jgi:hypothetical protein
MKTKTALVVLSVFIILAASFIAWWMLFEASFQMEAPINKGEGIIGYAMLVPEHETLANLARYLSVPLMLLAIALLVISVFRKPAVQLILGIVCAVITVFIAAYGFPTTFISSVPVDGQSITHFLSSPTGPERLAQGSIAVVVVCGLAVFGLSIAQLIQLKKTASI